MTVTGRSNLIDVFFVCLGVITAKRTIGQPVQTGQGNKQGSERLTEWNRTIKKTPILLSKRSRGSLKRNAAHQDIPHNSLSPHDLTCPERDEGITAESMGG